jgi:hypothetical protein
MCEILYKYKGRCDKWADFYVVDTSGKSFFALSLCLLSEIDANMN